MTVAKKTLMFFGECCHTHGPFAMIFGIFQQLWAWQLGSVEAFFPGALEPFGELHMMTLS